MVPLLAGTVSTVKIETSITSQERPDSPLLFGLRYNLLSEGWVLPYSNMTRSTQHHKWLCPLLNQGATNDVTISVSTASRSIIQFSLAVVEVPQFQVGLEKEVSVGYISGPAPVFYYIDIADQTDLQKRNILEVRLRPGSAPRNPDHINRSKWSHLKTSAL